MADPASQATSAPPAEAETANEQPIQDVIASDDAPRKRPRADSDPTDSHDDTAGTALNNGNVVPVLEASLFGVRGVDDTLRVVIEFISRFATQQHLEIEAKFGLLLDKQTKQRIRLPILSETVLAPGQEKWTRFESNMPAEWHQRINARLNRRVEDAQRPQHRGHRVTHKRQRECDRFYESPQGRIRVSIDTTTGQVLEGGVVRKERLADLNIHLPACPFDCRLSVNTETPVPMPDGPWILERDKNRVSYKHQHCQVDLTQVNSKANEALVKETKVTTHELELEVWDTAALQREFGRKRRNERNVFDDLVRVFLDNIRVLARLPA